MNIIDITEENIAEYTDYINPDVAENIGRDYFRGLLVLEKEDEQPPAVLIWEYKHLEDAALETESRIVWFSVKEEKAGYMLLDAYTKKAEADGAKKSTYMLPEGLSNELSILESAGFSMKKTESPVIKVTLEELSVLSVIKGIVPKYILPVCRLTINLFRKGIAKCVSDNRKGILEDLEFLPINWYDTDVSCCVYNGGSVNGFLLVNKTATGKIVVDLFFAYEPEAGKNLLYMINFSVREALKKYPKDTVVKLVIHNEISTALVKKLFPRKHGKICIMGERG